MRHRAFIDKTDVMLGSGWAAAEENLRRDILAHRTASTTLRLFPGAERDHYLFWICLFILLVNLPGVTLRCKSDGCQIKSEPPVADRTDSRNTKGVRPLCCCWTASSAPCGASHGRPPRATASRAPLAHRSACEAAHPAPNASETLLSLY